jgi:hypothetical protein
MNIQRNQWSSWKTRIKGVCLEHVSKIRYEVTLDIMGKNNTRPSEQFQSLIKQSWKLTKTIHLIHMYMKAHFPGLVQALHWKVAGVKYVSEPTPSPLS